MTSAEVIRLDLPATMKYLNVVGACIAEVLSRETDVENLDLLPSNIDLSGAEIALTNEISREHTFARVIADAVPNYDIILVVMAAALISAADYFRRFTAA